MSDQPPPTRDDMMERGVHVFTVAGPRSSTIEEWVQELAKSSGLDMDWRMVGGYGAVLVLGDTIDVIRGQRMCQDGIELLRDLYMACGSNWTKTPNRSDVQFITPEIDL